MGDVPVLKPREAAGIRVRAYHGREEPRVKPAASRQEPPFERTRVAFGCCNGRFGSRSPSSSPSEVPHNPQ